MQRAADPIRQLSKSAIISLMLVSTVFFLYALAKAPLLGMVKVSMVVFVGFKSAFVVLTGLLFLFFVYRED